MGIGGSASGPSVVVHTVSYLPWRLIGAELATHNLLRYLVGQGWQATVVPHGAGALDGWPLDRVHEVDGVRVVHPIGSGSVPADLIYAHAPFTRQARRHADALGVPLVVALHGGPPGWGAARVAEAAPDLAIANSAAMRASLDRTGLPVHVLNPPVFAEEHQRGWTRTPQAVTLVNPSRGKGGEVLAELAERMPEVPFLVVGGGYATEDVPDFTHLPNVTCLPHGTDMTEVWRHTRVLIMPSLSESWGMVAVEAMGQGIPVIGSTAPGLVEALGCAGKLIVPADDRCGWEAAVALLLADPYLHRDLGILGMRRAAELDPAPQLRATERALMSLIGKEVPMATARWRNRRTGQEVDLDPDTPSGRRLDSLPLVWERVGGPGGEPATPEAAPPPGPPARRVIPELSEPAPGASQEEWAEYAVACGAPRDAAERATRAALIAMFGGQ